MIPNHTRGGSKPTSFDGFHNIAKTYQNHADHMAKSVQNQTESIPNICQKHVNINGLKGPYTKMIIGYY